MIPYTREDTFETVAGQENCIALEVPFRGFLQRLVVKQTSGTLSGYSFDLYDRRDACAIYAESSQADEDFENELQAKEVHRLIATQTVAGGQAVSAQYGLSIGYENRDERLPDSRRATGKLYLSITPGGTGAKTFAIGYTVASPTVR